VSPTPGFAFGIGTPGTGSNLPPNALISFSISKILSVSLRLRSHLSASDIAALSPASFSVATCFLSCSDNSLKRSSICRLLLISSSRRNLSLKDANSAKSFFRSFISSRL
jgi:hypothetical protein